jgi:hypothetical protein
MSWLGRGALLALLLAACGDDGPSCATIDPACQPTYQPTFDNAFSRTFAPTCGVSGSSCHSSEGHQNGLILDDADQAYSLLLDGRVVPGDPSCSLLVERLESTDSSFRMPPGTRSLSAGDRCAIEQWIAAGAAR